MKKAKSISALYKELGIKPPKTKAQLQREYTKKANALPDETKKTFLQALHEGKTVGEARKLAGIDDIMVAGQLVIQLHETTTISSLKTVDEI